MTAPLSRSPATPEGRQLLKDMLCAARMDGSPDGFHFDKIDFDQAAADAPAEMEAGYATYIDYLESRNPDDLDASERAALAEWKMEKSDKRCQERERGGK